MRTTVDLPDEVLQRVRHIAAERGMSVSGVIAEYVERGVFPPTPPPGDRISIDPRTGLKVLSLGRVITNEDVRAALDDE